MPNEPNRPGKHRAAHKAPRRSAVLAGRIRSRLTTAVSSAAGLCTIRPSANALRHAGTAAAAGAVIVAGAAVGSASDDASTETVAALPDERKQPWIVGGDLTAARAVPTIDEASRDAIRAQIDQLRSSGSHDGRTELGAGGVASAEELVPTDPRQIALQMLPEYGWDSSEFSCLDELWIGESNWEVTATNPTSGAYGIPQSLPPEKMAAAGPDWRTNPATQIEWGLDYIAESYGSPCAANEFKNANNWY